MMEGTDDEPGRQSFEQQSAQRELVDSSAKLHWLFGTKMVLQVAIVRLKTDICLIVCI